jgi:outer membrane receptor for ferrienterochelin and colicins
MGRVISIFATVALAVCAAQQAAPDYAATADRLDQARIEIAPALGATTYTLDSRRLLDKPGGESRSLAESLLQLPGVTLGPDGQVHVRGQ